MNGEMAETETRSSATSRRTRTTGIIHQALFSRANVRSSRRNRERLRRARMRSVDGEGARGGGGLEKVAGEEAFLDQVGAESEDIHVGREKAGDGVARMADGRFAADVEGRVDEDGAAGAGVESGEHGVEGGVGVAVDGLHASGKVDVRDGGNRRASFAEAIGPGNGSVIHNMTLSGTVGGEDGGGEEHVGGRGGEVEPGGGVFGEDDGREGAEGLAQFYFLVEALLHVGGARVGEDGAGAERARAEFGAALEEADDITGFEAFGQAGQERVGGKRIGGKLVRGEGGGDFGIGVSGPEKGAAHGIVELVGRARGAVLGKMIRERGAEGPAGVAGGGLDPEAAKRAFAEEAGVGDAVEGDAAGEAEVLFAGESVKGAGEAEDDFFGDVLDGASDVAVELSERGFGCARRDGEELGEAGVGHRLAVEIAEVVEVEAEGTVGAEIEQVLENQIDEARFAVGREAHELVFARVDAEAAVVSESGVEEAEGVREAELAEKLEIGAGAAAERGGGPFADAVEREDGGVGERRREEGAGGVRLVMAGEMNRRRGETECAKFVFDHGWEPELGVQPVGHRGGEGAEAAGCDRESGGEDALEFEERLFVVDDGVERAGGLGNAIGDGVAREGSVVFFAGETFLLNGGDDGAVFDEGGGGIVVERAEAQDAHGDGFSNSDLGFSN